MVELDTLMIRRGGSHDVPFMRKLLPHAHSWNAHHLDDVPSNRYVEAWGRPGDAARIALAGGHRVGIGWFRLFPQITPGHAFLDPLTPELTIVLAQRRHAAEITQALLDELLRDATASQHPGLSIALSNDDPLFDLYKRSGFEHVREHYEATILDRRL